ncbi:MAG TPA: Ku protein [Stellaceae bacterium]|nr:Ku protein [Stellaceae bacterium]
MSGPRTVWKGYLSLARISCAVRLQPAVVRMDRLGLQPLNRTTLNRAQLRPYDPQTGREIGRDALLKGYEFEPGRFVVVEDRELAELRVESMRNIVLDRFLDASTVDAAYLDTPYYLLPDAPASAGSYALIRAAMLRTGRAAIGHIVLGGREYAALVQPRGRGLVLTTMRAAAELRSEETAFAGLAEDEPDPQLVEMASLVVGQLNGTFDPRRDFRERFQEALFQLVQAKLRGEKPVFPPAAPAIRVTALGEAVASSLRAGEPAERAVSSRYSTALRQ